MTMHGIGICRKCGAVSGLFLNYRQDKAVWQCVNLHRYTNDGGKATKRLENARNHNISFQGV